MSLVAAKCTNCGAALTVESSKDAAICEFCGTPFIVEKAIANVTMGGNNNISIESAVFNIQGEINRPTISNLIKRAEEFEKVGDFVTASSYYEQVLDLEYSNEVAKTAIDRIKNYPLISVEFTCGFLGLGTGVLTLTRKELIHKTKKKTLCFPLDSIVEVESFMGRLTITTDSETVYEYETGNSEGAKDMEQTLKRLLTKKRYSK